MADLYGVGRELNSPEAQWEYQALEADRIYQGLTRLSWEDDTMKIGDVFPSAFLRAGDLGNRKHALTIRDVQLEKVGDDDKPVCYFNGKEKGLVLNKTNATVIASFLGGDTDEWLGKRIVLYPTKVNYQGQTVDAIRVEQPLEDGPAADEIPF